ncbi:TPA: DoxX family membrane protein [Legionella pneumophila]|uniref:FAD-dependent oxidoreductase n=1 Tax=Legionella pneumophila TaxID=446 RepID=UPI00047FD92F|nr:FAD-dependent oxidoreductase [Legionella pneumophila]MCK1871592.1 FAD-dependent oxidoreductase [Legionella pneumophila]MDI2080783.1 FAD-dependent oxidoreductase [Legionella pneumophila]MDR9845741.1 FAD-dependent oxidoreductase [Legionella pneumophila]MDW8914007.1 FAD-dependent oxidoreductase [Legionella pneumophila]MDW8957328.1 FAD-dependent oxidoreductase [Legionella pneumophila]
MQQEDQAQIPQNSRSFSRNTARCFDTFMDTVDFLGRIGWPVIDLAFRIWIAQQLLVSAILLTNHWDTAVYLAKNEYPVPWLSPEWEALLGILAQFVGGISLLLGLFTRCGSAIIIGFAVMTQVYYQPIDLNLLWIALMLGYVLRGPGPLSLDNLFEHGFSRSPLPFAMLIVTFVDRTREFFSSLYLFSLRMWLMISLLLINQHIQLISSDALPLLMPWLPLNSASIVFNNVSLFMAIFLGLGLATRIVAIFGLIVVLLSFTPGVTGFYLYWMVVMAILFISGPGILSLDHLIFHALKKHYPQLSGKPAFSLDGLPRVVIIGAGFGGIACAKALRHMPVKITLIDRHNYHLFQPFLYQIATGSLSPADIAISIRSIFLEQFNAEILLGNVTGINKEERLVIADNFTIPYDYLVIATGATHSYFGKDSWAPYAPGLKTINDGTSVRSRIIKSFELAEIAESDEERKQFLNFVIVGAGPTGVELAGAIAELARFGIVKEFRHFDPASANIILVQAAPRILPTFSEQISQKAQRYLESMGVKVLVNSMVEQIDSDGVIINKERIYSKSVFWAAGVAASPASKWLQLEADPAGRVKVNDDLTVAGYSNIFVIGDTAASNAWNGKPVPGIAPAAKQGGAYVAKVISKRIYNNNSRYKPFKYIHYGSLATVGRKAAVAEFDRFKISGELAWWFWGGVHVFFLVGSRNRLSVILNWLWSYYTFRANNLLITDDSLNKKNKSGTSEV